MRLVPYYHGLGTFNKLEPLNIKSDKLLSSLQKGNDIIISPWPHTL